MAIYEETGGKPVPRYGFIDRDGNEVVSPKYIESRDFHDGVAAVQTADGWGYIDKTGKETLAPVRMGRRFYGRQSLCDGAERENVAD